MIWAIEAHTSWSRATALIDTSFPRTIENRVVQMAHDHERPPRARAIISYAQESDEHAKRVRHLADRLSG